MRNIGTDSSTCANVNESVASGRKTNHVDAIAASNVDVSSGTEGGGEDAVLVNVGGRGDAIVFSDEVESVPSLEDESDDDDDEDSWESEREEEEEEVDEELEEILADRLRILADCRALKNLAEAFLHPEQPVKANPTTFGRNYFERPSAPAVMDDEDAGEEAEILEDVKNLKKAAMAYLHPELGVKSEDPTLFGRNYFERPSAPEVEDLNVTEERARVLAEAAALKKLALDYMHPEMGVMKADGEMFGRNYFQRPSAPETEEDEFADERAEVLEEAAALKKLVVDYLHPEVGVIAEDATLFGRNYFERASAPDIESMEEAEERARILSEASALKKLALAYMHPEVGVKSTNPALFGRNYFNRYSALETEEDEFVDERAEILEEAAALKKSAAAYLHPEVGVVAEDATLFGRNYFERASAPDIENMEEAEERARILAEAAALKKFATDYMHPEVGVTATDPTLFGRNYFYRFSTPSVELVKEKPEESPEQSEHQEVSTIKNLAAAVKGANLPSTKNSKLSSFDKDLGATKKSASTVDLFGLSDEVH